MVSLESTIKVSLPVNSKNAFRMQCWEAELRRKNSYYYSSHSVQYHFNPGVFNIFQAKDPHTDGEMEQGPPTIYIV